MCFKNFLAGAQDYTWNYIVPFLIWAFTYLNELTSYSLAKTEMRVLSLWLPWPCPGWYQGYSPLKLIKLFFSHMGSYIWGEVQFSQVYNYDVNSFLILAITFSAQIQPNTLSDHISKNTVNCQSHVFCGILLTWFIR